MNAVHRAASTDYRLVKLTRDHPRYAPALREASGEFPAISAIGNLEILETGKLALFCSARCSGRLILQTYDLAVVLRELALTVVGGFHTPVEQECLRLLLQGSASLIVCPARGICGMRIPRDWRQPIDEGRLLVLSPFDEKDRRVTASLAQERNDFVARVADAVLIAHAAPGSRTESFGWALLERDKPVYTLASTENGGLVGYGAQSVSPATLQPLLATAAWFGRL